MSVELIKDASHPHQESFSLFATNPFKGSLNLLPLRM